MPAGRERGRAAITDRPWTCCRAMPGTRTTRGIGPGRWDRSEPNDLGLFDMHGNVWNWCHDSTPTQRVEYVIRVLRGGSFRYHPSAVARLTAKTSGRITVAPRSASVWRERATDLRAKADGEEHRTSPDWGQRPDPPLPSSSRSNSRSNAPSRATRSSPCLRPAMPRSASGCAGLAIDPPS